jgi:hypothetical protein
MKALMTEKLPDMKVFMTEKLPHMKALMTEKLPHMTPHPRGCLAAVFHHAS